jgi:S-adenosylmethionine:tRNA ribosyltransferase-isomerase
MKLTAQINRAIDTSHMIFPRFGADNSFDARRGNKIGKVFILKGKDTFAREKTSPVKVSSRASLTQRLCDQSRIFTGYDKKQVHCFLFQDRLVCAALIPYSILKPKGKVMKVDDFDFDLPRELIAQRPVSPRDSSKLLRIDAELSDHRFDDLPDFLEAGDLMVFNNTRVIPARLKGVRGQANVEITLHKHEGEGTWIAFVRGAKRLRLDDVVTFGGDFSATVLGKDGPEVTLRFNRSGSELMEALEEHGGMPLPPYIKREGLADARDKSDYQTVFADKEGAVAAPTAGLHFTPELLEKLKQKGIGFAYVTLHVGAGTFLPVKVDLIADHKMHAEFGVIDEETVKLVNETHAKGHRVVAVGTTSLRLLESAGGDDGLLKTFEGDTDIFITPGYRFKIVDKLITNFHLPKSTLFMLVSAFAGFDRMKAAYTYAIQSGYRFYSYGDGSILSRSDKL